jgi:hypothetical protein
MRCSLPVVVLLWCGCAHRPAFVDSDCSVDLTSFSGNGTIVRSAEIYGTDLWTYQIILLRATDGLAVVHTINTASCIELQPVKESAADIDRAEIVFDAAFFPEVVLGARIHSTHSIGCVATRVEGDQILTTAHMGAPEIADAPLRACDALVSISAVHDRSLFRGRN